MLMAMTTWFVVGADGGLSVKPDPMWDLEVDEQQSDLGGGGDVAHGEAKTTSSWEIRFTIFYKCNKIQRRFRRGI